MVFLKTSPINESIVNSIPAFLSSAIYKTRMESDWF